MGLGFFEIIIREEYEYLSWHYDGYILPNQGGL